MPSPLMRTVEARSALHQRHITRGALRLSNIRDIMTIMGRERVISA